MSYRNVASKNPHSKASANNSQKLLNGRLTRVAIDYTGELGSSYDAKNDSVLNKVPLRTTLVSKKLEKPAHCQPIKIDWLEGKNLLHMIGISGELWLSLMLNITSEGDLTPLTDPLFLMNTNTRYLWYYNEIEEIFVDEQKVAAENLSKSLAEINATHLITSYKLGIRAFIVLQLPFDHQTDFDDVLTAICNDLTTKKSVPTKAQKDVLNRITSTNIFSNISYLAKMTTLTDFCQAVSKQKRPFESGPLEYSLCSIVQFDSNYPKETALYVQVEQETNDQIEQYLIQASLKMKELIKCLEEHLKHQLDGVQQLIKDTTQMYSSEIDKIRDLILEIRRGERQQDAKIRKLIDESEQSLQKNINRITQDLQTWKKKATLDSVSNGDSAKQLKIVSPPSSLKATTSSTLKSTTLSSSTNISTSISDVSKQRFRSSVLSAPTINFTNVLLLGELGISKSTFINALVNYLTFETLEQACSGKPLAVMPVSFLMTVGDNFEERLVKFGDVNPNEDHDHPGQSVTQHCTSYVFPIGTKTKLRIIDTPGMGDTRGLDQDDCNLQHILSFINNLSHLDAICILLKPNESRLNIVLRSYFTRLLNFLGENARNNIVFCFTNTRTTFYAPGNTGPLLKEMIDHFPIKDIPFKKSNTFCFDSESFRYLIALRNRIEFDDYQKQKYQRIWSRSVTESNRLLGYICGELQPFSEDKWRSIEHADFTISPMIRPMLETTRNILRNIGLLKENLSKPLIKLHPVVLPEPLSICYNCKRTPQRYSDFWILPDDLHVISDKCDDCNCSEKKHVAVDYKLEYEILKYTSAPSLDELKFNFNQLRLTLLEFAQFYSNVGDTSKQHDLISFSMKRQIDEENQICSENDHAYLNSTLHTILISLKEEYIERRKASKSIRLPIDLASVYEHIKVISKIDEIDEQMKAIKQAQNEYMKKHEKQVL